MAPKDVHNLIPGTSEYDMLLGKEKLKLQMKSSLLVSRPKIREILLDYLGGAQCNHLNQGS